MTDSKLREWLQDLVYGISPPVDPPKFYRLREVIEMYSAKLRKSR